MSHVTSGWWADVTAISCDARDASRRATGVFPHPDAAHSPCPHLRFTAKLPTKENAMWLPGATTIPDHGLCVHCTKPESTASLDWLQHQSQPQS